MKRKPTRFAIPTALLFLFSIGPPFIQAEWSGRIYLDQNANGIQDPKEDPLANIVVSNGRDVTISNEHGLYRLPERSQGFTTITDPAGFRCPTCYRRGGGDFGLLPATSTSDDFFFIHMSDSHVYADIEDFEEFSAPSLPWWIPDWVGAWLVLRFLDSKIPGLNREQIVEELRAAVAPYRDVSDASEPSVFLAYQAELLKPGSPLGQVEPVIRSSFAEVTALQPEFIIHTGDLVLEGNEATPEAMERWFPFYLDLANSTGLPIYETIGNNELAGTSREDFSPSDPRHGKYYFRRFLGPTHYSFDRGQFHFSATDTHRSAASKDAPRAWDFTSMEPDVRAWLDADLRAHAGKTLVVLNHEPFHTDPAWEFDDPTPADDGGLFRQHGVAYSLSGHTHMNGFTEQNGTTHITTGALSGYRWTLPSSLSPRGYRLFYAKGDRLYSAWKNTGQPLLGFVDPKGSPKIHPASKGAADPSQVHNHFDVVVVAVAAQGPFASISLKRDDSLIPLESWGDYFFHTRVDVGQGPLVLTAHTEDGQTHHAELAVAPPTANSRATSENQIQR